MIYVIIFNEVCFNEFKFVIFGGWEIWGGSYKRFLGIYEFYIQGSIGLWNLMVFYGLDSGR